MFVTDSNFLSYAAVPDEFIDVVRRRQRRVQARVRVDERVQDNRRWHTVRGRIDDPELVNYWGFNFALESDADTYNKSSIQSVTVTDLARRSQSQEQRDRGASPSTLR